MSITFNDRAATSYDEMAVACSKDIEDYKTLMKSIEAMIAQKQRNLQNIKGKTVGLVKTSLEIPMNQPAENFDDTGVDMVEDLTPEMEEDSPATTPPKKERTQKSKPSNCRKAAEKGRVKRADKPREPADRSQNIADILIITDLGESFYILPKKPISSDYAANSASTAIDAPRIHWLPTVVAT